MSTDLPFRDSSMDSLCDSNWENIPAELLAQIVSHLSVAARIRAITVCKAWARSLMQPCHWTVLDLASVRESTIEITDNIVRNAISLSKPATHRRYTFMRSTFDELGSHGESDNVPLLTTLILTGCRLVTEAIIMDLDAWPHLVELCIHDCFSISLRRLQALESLQRLTRLEVDVRDVGSKNCFGSSLHPALASALQRRQIRRLDLGDNDLGDAGIEVLASAIGKDAPLISVHLNGNAISKHGVAALADAFSHNATLQKLDLRDNPIGGDGAAALAGLLGTGSCHLASLGLCGCDVCDFGAHKLAGALVVNDQLTRLNLRRNDISDAGAILIAKALMCNRKLTSLDLSFNDISDDAAGAFGECLETNSSLKSLALIGNALLGDKGAQALASGLALNTTLEQLDLSNCSISNAGALHITCALQSNHSSALTSIQLSYNRLGDAAARSLSKLVAAEDCPLRFLRLIGCEIGDVGAVALAHALTINLRCQLRELNLCNNNDIGNLGANAFASALRVNPTLRLLDLGDSGIGNAGAVALAGALGHNRSLISLSLRQTMIADEGASALSAALLVNGTLTSLDLAGCSIGDAGAMSFLPALEREGCCLRDLNLAYNPRIREARPKLEVFPVCKLLEEDMMYSD
eukprot:jgi/Mesvir1/18432/Mv14298-RA.1